MTDLYGLVLAGGRSSRMRTDKGLLQFHAVPQRQFVFDLLTAFCEKVFTSCRQDQQMPPALNPLFDRFEIESPLNGILTALTLHPEKSWLTVPIDMPNIDHSAVAYLQQQRDRNKVATCFFDTEGVNPEPMFVIWEHHASSELKKYYLSGEISPRQFLKSSNVKLVQVPDMKILLNVNTPEEWKQWKALNNKE